MRLLREAQLGNEAAVRTLLEPYATGLWSICRGQVGADRARSALNAFRVRLSTAIPSFAAEQPFGAQLYTHLWRHLADGMEPADGPVERPDIGGTLAPKGDDAALVRATLDAAHPFDRLVWLFATVTGLSADRLAELTREPEDRIRRARARVAWSMLEAMSE